MKINKAVITAAAPGQRALPLQTLVDRDGTTKSVLAILVEEARQAGVEELCVVVHPGDEATYRQAADDERLTFVTQESPRGYGHAVWCAREFVGSDPFLHMVGDHVFVSGTRRGCAQQLVEAAEEYDCVALSGVQPTRETLLPRFGAVGGHRLTGTLDLYHVECVLEKPTPTEAEQTLIVPGLRAGYYLCFFGLHILPDSVMSLLETQIAETPGSTSLSSVLALLAKRERYLALEIQGQRHAIDARYGLLTAQLALAFSGSDREEVLAGLCELLAQRTMSMEAGA